MFILLGVMAVILLAAAARLATPYVRRHRLASELRGDWWSPFERDFRAYAGGVWNEARDAEGRT